MPKTPSGPQPRLDRDLWKARLRRLGQRLRDDLSDARRRWVLLGLAALGLGSCSAGAALAAWNHACAGGCPTAQQIEDFAPQQASLVYDASGGLLGQFYRERRQVITLQELPPYVPLAFVAIEDRRFFEHEGVDPRRLIGAVRDNLLEGFGASGASTITMQLARNLFPQQLPAGEKTLRRKIAEARLAILMERRFSKEKILELYLNHIYLGAGAYGIEAAARTYFGKPAKQLSVAEAATLAALPKAPSAYNPRRNPDAALGRRNLVLAAMLETGVIADDELGAARAQPLALAPPVGARSAPYFVEQVRRDLEDLFGELLYTGGLRIHTTLDPALQAATEQALEEHLRQIEGGQYGPYPHTTYERFTARQAGEVHDLASTPYLQGLAVVMEPVTGDVLAMVGGRDFRQSQFNRATQALRQPGSAFKPFVYAAALEKGRSPLSRVSDSPFSLRLSDGTVWAPKNYGGEYSGTTTMRQALKLSRNMAAIRLGREAGIEKVRAVAQRAGLSTRIPGWPSTYIGAAAVYPLELVRAYASFGNGGQRVEPHFIRRIEDHRGRLLWQPPHHPRPAMDPAVAWILTDMLREVVDHGTGYNARNPAVGALSYEIPAAGKTGTTNDNTDVWFVGYTPDLLAGVWLGFDQPKTILAGATGGSLAVPIWARVVRSYYQKHEAPDAWARPGDVVARRISRWTGKAVTDDCVYAINAYVDYFPAAFAPEPGCDTPTVPKLVDPTPELPGRPVFPGQPRVPRPEEFVNPPKPVAGDGAKNPPSPPRP